MQSKHRAIPLLCALLGIAWSAPLACALATGVTINGRTDQVYDGSSDVLYFSTNNGTIQRYNRATNTLHREEVRALDRAWSRSHGTAGSGTMALWMRVRNDSDTQEPGAS